MQSKDDITIKMLLVSDVNLCGGKYHNTSYNNDNNPLDCQKCICRELNAFKMNTTKEAKKLTNSKFNH